MLKYYCSKRSKSRKTPMMICEIFWSYKTKLSSSNCEKVERKKNSIPSLLIMRHLGIYFLQLSQNFTWDCLLISVFLPVFTSLIVLFWSLEQLYDHTGKNRQKHKQSDVKFWLNWIKYGTVHIDSCVWSYNISLPSSNYKAIILNMSVWFYIYIYICSNWIWFFQNHALI